MADENPNMFYTMGIICRVGGSWPVDFKFHIIRIFQEILFGRKSNVKSLIGMTF